MATKTTSAGNQNLMAALTYLLGIITGVIFLVIERKNAYIRFHAAQSVVTFGIIFILSIILPFIPVLGRVLLAVLNIVQLVVWILLMVKAYQGVKYKLPYIGDLAEDLLKKMG